MTLSETLISSLTVSSVSVLAWLAYKHNHAYRKIYPFLYGSSMLTAACFLSFMMGITFHIQGNNLTANSIPIFFFVLLIVNGFFALLYHLPHLFKKNEKNNKPE